MYKKIYLKPILLGLIALIFASCDKDYNELGTDFVGDEHFDILTNTVASVNAYNQKLGPIATNNLPVNALGIYDNPAFGSTKANFVTQVELSATNPTFNNTDPEEYDVNPTAIDSVILDIPYFSKLKLTNTDGSKTYELDSIYGVNESKFRLNVFQSNYYLRDLDPNQALGAQQLFYSDENNTIDSNKIPVLLNNSTDTDENEQFFFDKREHKLTTFEADGVTPVTPAPRTPPSMRLHLRNDVFTSAILNAPTGKLADNPTFKNYFRGLYFKVESTGNSGNMAMLNFRGGKITIYYNEDKKKVVSDVTSFERVNKAFALNLNGNTVSLLDNYNESVDYLNAANNTTQEASQLFLKGGQGSMAVIDIFGPDSDNNGIADEIEVIKANGWIVNEANLSFYVDKLSMSDTRSAEPNRIFLYDLTNKQVLIDYAFDGTSSANPKNNKYIFGGLIEKESVTNGRGERYKIKITNHVRNLIKNDSTNVRLGLSLTEDIRNVGFSRLKTANTNTDRAPSMSVVSPLGTILYGSSPVVPDDKRLKLEIYYTKPN